MNLLPKMQILRHALILGVLASRGLVVEASSGCIGAFESVLRSNSLEGMASDFRALEEIYRGRLRVSTYGSIEGLELLKIRVPNDRPASIKVVITAGLHGNEILGPAAARDILERFMKDKTLLERIDLTLYPLTSPLGYKSQSRRVRSRVDLNRVFFPDSREPEVQLLAKDLHGHHFDLALDLHGGPTRSEFFVIRSGEDQGLAERSVAILGRHNLLNSYDGRYPGTAGIKSDPDRYQMSSPGVASSATPGTLKAFMSQFLKVPNSYTLEYPGRMDASQALRLYVDLVESFLRQALIMESI